MLLQVLEPEVAEAIYTQNTRVLVQSPQLPQLISIYQFL